MRRSAIMTSVSVLDLDQLYYGTKSTLGPENWHFVAVLAMTQPQHRQAPTSGKSVPVIGSLMDSVTCVTTGSDPGATRHSEMLFALLEEIR